MVDFGALGQVVWVSFAAALVLTLAFTGGVVLTSGGRTAGVARHAAGYALLALCAAITVLALYVLFDK